MAIFLCLLSLILGILLLNVEFIFLNIIIFSLIVYINLKYFKKNLKIILFQIFFLIIGLVFININFVDINTSNIWGIVVKKSDNYLIIRTFFTKYYVTNNDELNLFDIVNVSGSRSELNFIHYESSFDFNKFLKLSGVSYYLKINKINTLLKFPLDFEGYKEDILLRINDVQLKNYVNLILFNEEIDDKATNLLINILSISGVYLNFALYGLSKSFAYICNKKESRFLSLILLSPYILFNIYRFSVFKTAVLFIFNLIFLNKHYDNLKKISLLYLCFLLLDIRLIYSASFYISLIFSFIFMFSKLYISSAHKFVKLLKTKIIFFIFFIPFYLEFNGYINFINLIFNLSFAGFFKIFFTFSLLSFYGIHLKFLEKPMVDILNFFNLIEIKELNINIPKFDISIYIIYFLLMILLMYFLEINYKRNTKIILILTTVFSLFYIIPFKEYFTFEVSLLNVGQGDSTYIHYKDKNFLIDTGGLLNYDLAENSLIPFLRRKRVYKLDAVFITHYDYDHYGSLESLNKKFNILTIYDYNSSFPVYSSNLKFINLNTLKNATDENEKSLVIYLDVNNISFLFMGDATTKVERNILNNYQNLKCDYIKLGHHGSDTSSSYEFLKEVSPKEAIVSCGINNKFNHPSEKTLQNLTKLNIKCRRTDLEGTITYKFRAF